MEPWATSYTKLVPGLDEEALSVIDFARSRFFLVEPVTRMSGLGALGLGLGAVRQAVLYIFEFAAESTAMSCCCGLFSLKLPYGLIITVT